MPGAAYAYDVDTIRRDFPILAEHVNGHPLVWLDNAATTQKPQEVIDRLTRFYCHENSNVHRGAHELATRATQVYEDARASVAQFLGAPSPDDIVFVRGATEAINLVARAGAGRRSTPATRSSSPAWNITRTSFRGSFWPRSEGQGCA